MEPTGMITYHHKLILPVDANHRNTLYAGSLLRISLEAAYTTAHRHIGDDANLVLRRVLNLECLRPVPVGAVTEIQGAILLQNNAYLVVGLHGTPLKPTQGPWMEGLMGFAQIDEAGGLIPLPGQSDEILETPSGDVWKKLQMRMKTLMKAK